MSHTNKSLRVDSASQLGCLISQAAVISTQSEAWDGVPTSPRGRAALPCLPYPSACTLHTPRRNRSANSHDHKFYARKTSYCISSHIRTRYRVFAAQSIPPLLLLPQEPPEPSLLGTFTMQGCESSQQMQTFDWCIVSQSGVPVRGARCGVGKEVGALAALHPLICFTSLMHFPSVTRAPKSEGSDSALYRLRKEMEEFHLAIGSDIFGKHQHSTEMDSTTCLVWVATNTVYSKLLWQSHVNMTEIKY